MITIKMIEEVRHKKIKPIIGLLTISLLSLSVYFMFFFQNLKLEIYNKTNYDIDSLQIGDEFFNVKKGTAIHIENCSSISMQAGIPFGLPIAKIKRRNDGTMLWYLCGTGVKEIKRGRFKFDIEIREDSSSYLLYWKEHQ
jgi:hypothetical protein